MLQLRAFYLRKNKRLAQIGKYYYVTLEPVT